MDSWLVKKSYSNAEWVGVGNEPRLAQPCMDSCITWPICPVYGVNPPLPFMALASTRARRHGGRPSQAQQLRAFRALGDFAFDADLNPPRNSWTISFETMMFLTL